MPVVKWYMLMMCPKVLSVVALVLIAMRNSKHDKEKSEHMVLLIIVRIGVLI